VVVEILKTTWKRFINNKWCGQNLCILR